MISGPEIEWKFAFVSDATALARSVLPVPGGPCNSTPFGASSFIGFSAILISVSASTRTASAPGENDVTTNSNLRPMTLTLITSPRVIARPWRTCAMYCSPPMIRIASVGASDTFSAGRASALRKPTLSSIPTPALRRCIPSIRITPRFASSGYPRRTPAAVDFVPSMRTISPSFNSRIFMTSGSMRTIPRPASAGFASATRRNFSRPAAIFSVSPLAAGPHTRPSRDFATNRRYLNSCRNLETKSERERSRAGSLDRHLDRLRLRGRLLLRDPDLEDAVFQRRSGEVGLNLRREAQHALEGLVRPLAVLVVLLLLVPGAVRLRADLNPVRGDGQVDVLLRNAGEFRPDHELGNLVDQVDEGFADAQVGVGPTGEGGSPKALLEAPPEVVEPPVHVVQPGEGRNGRPRQAVFLLCLNLLALSLHGASPPRGLFRGQ